jgi:hypothetical protein
MMAAALEIGSDPPFRQSGGGRIRKCYSIIQIWQQAEEESEYQAEKLLSIVSEQ